MIPIQYEYNHGFQQDLARSKNYLETHKEEFDFLKKFSTSFLPRYLKKLRNENPKATIDEFKKILETDTVKFAETAFKSVHVFPVYMQYVACNYLKNNPKKFDEIYSKVKKEQELKKQSSEENNQENSTKETTRIIHFYDPSNTFDDYLYLYLKDLYAYSENIVSKAKEILGANKDFLTILDDTNPKISEKDKLTKLRKHCGKLGYSNRDIETLCRMGKYYLYGIKAFLPEDGNNLEKHLKQTLSNSISSLFEKFDRLDLFSKYNDLFENQCTTMNIPSFAKFSKPSTLSSEVMLQNMSIDDLMALNLYWMNKYTKELKTFYQSIFLLNDTDSLEKILSEIERTEKINAQNDNKKIKPKINFSNQDYEIAFLKWYILRLPSEGYINYQQERFNNGKLPKGSYERKEGNNFITYSFEPLANSIEKAYDGDYESFFYLNYGRLTDLKTDCIQIARYMSPIVNLYDMKDVSLEALLANLNQNSNIINFGIIPEKKYFSPNQTKFNFNSKNSFIGIGIDAHLTSPIREHIRLCVLTEFLKSINNTAIIPIYEGYEDIKDSIQLVTPFSDDQKKLIKNAVLQDNQKKSTTKAFNAKPIINASNRNYIYHLDLLRDSSNIPDFFKTDIIDKKGRKKRAFVKRYVDLETGTIYTRDENGSYIPITTNCPSSKKDTHSNELGVDEK